MYTWSPASWKSGQPSTTRLVSHTWQRYQIINGHKTKRPQTETATDRKGHKSKRPQTETTTDWNGHKTKWLQTRTATSVGTRIHNVKWRRYGYYNRASHNQTLWLPEDLSGYTTHPGNRICTVSWTLMTEVICTYFDTHELWMLRSLISIMKVQNRCLCGVVRFSTNILWWYV